MILCDYAGCKTKLICKDKEHHNSISTNEHLGLVYTKLKDRESREDQYFEKEKQSINRINKTYSVHTIATAVGTCRLPPDD